MTKQLCKNCKHLETDGMFGIFCGVGGDNTKYDCLKFEKAKKITEKQFFIEIGYHGVHYICRGARRYEFVGVEPRNLETLCELLNDFKGDD